VARHPKFERRGDDIYSSLPISLAQALLGSKRAVETVDGDVEVKIPAGTQPGALLRLRGRGAPGANGKRGNHYVRIMVELPSKLTPKARDLFEQFTQEAGLET